MKYKIQCPFIINNELKELRETLTYLTGAEYNDIFVSEVNNGCVEVCFMVRNHLIPKLRKCYMPENIYNTRQSLSKDFRNKIIKVVIQDEVVDLSGMSFFSYKKQFATLFKRTFEKFIYFYFFSDIHFLEDETSTDIHRFGNVLKPKVKAALIMYLLALYPQYLRSGGGDIVFVLSLILSFSNSLILSSFLQL